MVTTFDKTTVLRLEVEDSVSVRNNAKNPGGELGGWGWLTPQTFTGISGYVDATAAGIQVAVQTPYIDPSFTNVGVPYLRLAVTGGTPSSQVKWTTEGAPVTPGQWAGGSVVFTRFAPNTRAWLWMEFYNAAGAVVSTGNAGTAVGAAGVAYAPATQAPSGAVTARLRIDATRTNGGVLQAGDYIDWRNTMFIIGPSSGSVTNPGWIPTTYTDVLGPSHSISLKRDELSASILTAEILNAYLDPSQSTLVRPGKMIRLRALDATDGKWKPLFQGKITSGSTTYDPQRTDTKRARITLTALDSASALAQVTRPNGVASIAELRSLLEGCGVPFRVNGDSSQYPGVVDYVSKNDNATMLDQIAITRDSKLGYAWVDRFGLATVWDRANLPSTVTSTLDESVYSDLNLDYDTDRCINVVNVKLRRFNIANGSTVEVAYGPFVNQASVDQWGPHSADFTVQGLTDSASAMQTYATSILNANATPAVRLNSVTVPIRTAADVTLGKGLLDLYDLVTVKNTNAAINQNMRVTGIEHTIAPDKWLMQLSFTTTGNVSSPQQTPELAGAPSATVTSQFGSVYAETRGDGWGTAAPPNGVSGTPFNVPVSGVWQGRADGSAYLSTVGSGAVEIYIDGTYRGQLYLYFNQANTHALMIPAMFTFNITAGTHYLWVRKAFTSSDGNDFIKISGPILPN